MIELKQLAVGYQGQPVLQQVHTPIHPGEITVILGRNGAGKSTLVQTILGLLPPLQGEILIDGTPLASLSGTQRAQHMAYVQQSRNIPQLSVRSFVLHGRFPYLSWPRHYRPQDQQACTDALEHMQILPLQHRFLSELSGGERQKAYLAMALCQDTPYIFLDEPASYMDLPSQMELTRTLLQLKAWGKGIIVIEHDLCHALEWADRLIVLDAHQQVFSGTPAAFLQTHLDQEVFGVRLERIETSAGPRFFYTPCSPSAAPAPLLAENG